MPPSLPSPLYIYPYNLPISSTILPFTMACALALTLTLYLTSILPLAASGFPAPPPSTYPPVLTPTAACKTTLYPKLCRSILSASRSSNLYSYGEFSVKKCLKQAQKTSSIINRYLTRQSSLRRVDAGALEDCRLLSELNTDYLSGISAAMGSTRYLTAGLGDYVRTLLSGVVTNQQTCYDGLEAGRVRIDLVAPLSDSSALYSVSLGLVTNALLTGKFRGRKLFREWFLWPENRGVGGFQVQEKEESSKSSSQPENYNTKWVSSSFPAVSRKLVESTGDGLVVRDMVIVAIDGSGNFTTIGDAVAAAPNNTKNIDGYFVIYVKEGVYEENVWVAKNKKNLMLLGDGINRTVITGNRSYIDGWTTFNSATFAVMGERFTAIDITFKNTAGPEKHQAVALRNSADLSTFYRCSFEAYQDTLYVHSLRQFYRECDIYGTVDFIFGNAATVIQNCNLFARKPLNNQKIAFTAQGRSDPNQNTGISIQNSTVRAAPDLAEDLNFTKSYLGRPWKEYSRTVYMQSFIDSLIEPVGWLEWNGSFGLNTLYYGEFENYGPGANTSTRVGWPGYNIMTASDAQNFTVFNLTMGDSWLPSTDVPFSGGL